MAKLLLTTLLVAALVHAALLCDGQDDATVAGQCGASQEPSMARLVEDLQGETVLSRLLPSGQPITSQEPVKAKEQQRSASGQPITSQEAATAKKLQSSSSEQTIISHEPVKVKEQQISASGRHITSQEHVKAKEVQSSASGQHITSQEAETAKKLQSSTSVQPITSHEPVKPKEQQRSASGQPITLQEAATAKKLQSSTSVQPITSHEPVKVKEQQISASGRHITSQEHVQFKEVQSSASGQNVASSIIAKEVQQSASGHPITSKEPATAGKLQSSTSGQSITSTATAKEVERSVPGEHTTSPANPAEIHVKQGATAGNSKGKETHDREDGAQPVLSKRETAVPQSLAAGEIRIKRDAFAKKSEGGTPASVTKQVRSNPDKTSAVAAGEIQRVVPASKESNMEEKSPQTVSKDIPKPPVTTQKESQQRSATETRVGKDKKPQALPMEKSSKPSATTAAAEMRIRPKSSDSKDAPGTPPTLHNGKLPNREATAVKAAENQASKNSDKKETRLKHDAGKDNIAPSLAKGKSSNTEAVTPSASTRKDLPPRSGMNSIGKGPEVKGDVTSPSLAREKTTKTSAQVAGNSNKIQQRGVSESKETQIISQKTQPGEKTAEKRSATDSGRKEAHVKAEGVAKKERKDGKKSPQATSQQVIERQKRDAEETQIHPKEAGDVERVGETLGTDGIVKETSDVTEKQDALGGVTVAKENVTRESPSAESDDGKTRLPQAPPSPVVDEKVETSDKQTDQDGTTAAPSTPDAGEEERQSIKNAEVPAQIPADEHVHFVALGQATPEALPLTGLGEPSAMSLKTRRDPEIDEEDVRGGQEGDEARQADPRRFPSGGHRPSGKTEAPVLRFPPLPEGETFRTPELGLSEGLFLFSYLGDFLSWLQPYDFPVELVRDALWNRVTVTDLITESLQVEIGFIVCLCIGALLALALPIVAMCHACCNMIRGSKKSGGDRNSWDSSSSSGSCRRRGLLCSLHLVLVLLAAGVAAMFVTNEQVSNAVHSTPSIVHTALGDVGAFVRTTHHQLSFVTTKSLEQALSAATEDLDNADVLLGRPIQQEIAHEAGADVALEALSDVLTAVNDVSQKAVVLHEQCGETRGLALVAKERLADLRHQVDVAKRQCVGRDRALCDTLDVSGLDVVIRLESLMSDDQLAALRSLRNGNFSAAAQQARGDFQLIPREVEESTREARLGIRRELVRQRSYVQDSLVSLDSLSRDVGVRVDAARNLVLSSMQTVEDMEQWRWLVGLGACLTMLLLWVLLIAGAACGCCGSQEKARTTLIVGVCMTSIFSLVLWVVTLVTLVMGGHGEVFICRPLYASPDYSSLSRLLDRPGVLFPRGGGGFFRNVVGGDGGPNRTLDVPLRQVLQECEAGIPAYNALQLRQVFDTDFATGHGRWESLRMQLSRLNVDVASLRVLTPGLQVQLGNILTASGANVTQHRLALGGAVTARDLNTLADQLLGIASQASDLAMASRLETLAARTRRLLASHVLPLEQRKEDLVYRLTALEVSLAPLQRQANQSLSHLKAIQYYITHQGESIAQSAVNHYTTRILSYLQQARAHILTSVVKDVAPCRPLFEVFNAARQLLCRHIVDPLNGLWFASALSLLLLLIATPLSLKLVDAFKQNRECGLLSSNMSESPSETVDMQGNWNTPGSGEQDGW